MWSLNAFPILNRMSERVHFKTISSPILWCRLNDNRWGWEVLVTYWATVTQEVMGSNAPSLQYTNKLSSLPFILISLGLLSLPMSCEGKKKKKEFQMKLFLSELKTWRARQVHSGAVLSCHASISIFSTLLILELHLWIRVLENI